MKKAAAKENDGVEEGKTHKNMPQLQPSILALEDCLKLVSMHKDSAFELDAFVILPGEKNGPEQGVHDFANNLWDMLSQASDYHWK